MVIVPNEPVLGHLLKSKKDIEKYLDKSMDLMPHIKLFPTFTWEGTEEYLLIHSIKNLIPAIHSFEVNLLQLEKSKLEGDLYLKTQTRPEIENFLSVIQLHFQKTSNEQSLSIDTIDGRLTLVDKECIGENYSKIAPRLGKKIFSGVFIADKLSLFKNEGNGWQLNAEFHLD